MYLYGDGGVRYLAPSLSSSGVPIGSGSDAWAEFLHVDDRERLLDLHSGSVAIGTGYEALFRYAEPNSSIVWVVDRQERIGDRGERTWRGLSLDVTDLMSTAQRPIERPTPVPLAVYCLSRRETSRGASSDAGSALRANLGELPLTAPEIDLLARAIDDRLVGTVTMRQPAHGAGGRESLFSWAPFGDDHRTPLVALAVADVSAHRASAAATLRRLRLLVHSTAGTTFRLAPGGRARIRRDWLRQLDATLGSYSDLLERAERAEVRRLRTARRTALQCLESYSVTLTVDIGGHARQIVEIGLPDATGDVWDCALIPLSDTDTTTIRAELTPLANSVWRDPAAQLLRGLGNQPSVTDVISQLIRVGAHESHVTRRLTMVRTADDPGMLARRYSHTLDEPPDA